MDETLAALAAQQDELTELIDGLDAAAWHAPTACEGWDVADVMLHLVQTDEMAIASATGRFAATVDELTGGSWPGAGTDDAVGLMVERGRGPSPDELRSRHASGAARLLEVLGGMDLSTRVDFVAGELSARTLATTRLAETWIHTGDIAGAVGVTLPPSDRLRAIARLAWRTLPYAFESAGRTPAGPVAFRLVSPGGEPWNLLPDEPAVTTISGPGGGALRGRRPPRRRLGDLAARRGARRRGRPRPRPHLRLTEAARVPNLFTRVPDRPAPELPRALGPVVAVADLFMLLMISRPTTGSLRATWVTPATLLLTVATTVIGGPLAIDLLGRSGAARIGGVSLGLAAIGAACVAVVGFAQRGARRAG